jgi:hypothetical protein
MVLIYFPVRAGFSQHRMTWNVSWPKGDYSGTTGHDLGRRQNLLAWRIASEISQTKGKGDDGVWKTAVFNKKDSRPLKFDPLNNLGEEIGGNR